MIRIQQYNTGPRRIGVGGIDPGYQHCLLYTSPSPRD